MNLFALEPLILQRLREHVASDVVVRSTADYQALLDAVQKSPALHLIYDSGQIVETRPDGRTSITTQLWHVVCVVSNRRDSDAAMSARLEVGALAGQVMAALSGWKVEMMSAPLELASMPKARRNDSYLMTPLAFKSKVFFNWS